MALVSDVQEEIVMIKMAIVFQGQELLEVSRVTGGSQSSIASVDLRLLECNGFTYLKPSRGFKNLLLFKYMPFEDDPPHRFSQFLLF